MTTHPRELGERAQRDDDDQLTLDVTPHPEAASRGEDHWIAGAIKVAGEFVVRRDFNAGDEVAIQIADADGTIVASGLAEIGLPAFKPIKVRGEHLGTQRIHTAAVQ